MDDLIERLQFTARNPLYLTTSKMRREIVTKEAGEAADEIKKLRGAVKVHRLAVTQCREETHRLEQEVKDQEKHAIYLLGAIDDLGG